MSRLERVVASAASRAGLTIGRTSNIANRLPVEATDDDRRIIEKVRPFTMTSSERLWSLIRAVDYVVGDGIEGDFAECGVWRGGSIMTMALRLQELDVTDRPIWLYDTFGGMTAPTAEDVEEGTGRTAAEMLETTEVGDGNNVWCVASEDDVRTNVMSTGYPVEEFRFVVGDVARTLHEQVPERISLLRLDTDWYESTRLGLEILYPRLSVGGVCILDDYGHWLGARQAVDEYFAAEGHRPFMHPIDFSGRIFVKTR